VAASGGSRMLGGAGSDELVDAYAAPAGPGFFTAVRVGLATVKAWAEVYGKRIGGVSRLEHGGRSRRGRLGGELLRMHKRVRYSGPSIDAMGRG